jgi:hypothetical protein
VQKGNLVAHVSRGVASVAIARRHRENCAGTELMGLDITHLEAAHA